MSDIARCEVVIPAYNSEAYIEECVRSAQRQSMEDIGIIVVDDCSTDRTGELVRGMAETDGRIRYYRQERNLGVAAARNLGVAQARSEWIAFLDSDDMWRRDKLEKQFALQKETGAASLYYTGAELMGADGRALKRMRVSESVSYEELLCGNIISTSGVLCERARLARFPMERDDLHEDYICWLRLLSEYGPARGVDMPLHSIRLTSGSRSRDKWKSAVNTWRTYRYMRVPFAKAAKCFVKYAAHGVKRYWGKRGEL